MDRLPWELKLPIYERMGLSFWPEQLAILQDTTRQILIPGGEGSGKSFVTAADLVPHMMYAPLVRPDKFFKENGEPIWDLKTDRPRFPHFVLFGLTYEESHAEFEYIEEMLGKLDMLAPRPNMPSKPSDGRWRLVTKDGVVLQTWTTENPESIRSIEPLGVAVVEAGRQEWDTVMRVQGRISRAKAFAIYSGTLENANPWYTEWCITGRRENHIGIKTFSLPTWTNRALFPGGAEDSEILRLKGIYTDDLFAMRVAAEPRPPRDRVLPEFTETLVGDRKIPADAHYEIWVDPGYATAHAVLWVAWWHEKRKKRKGQPEDDRPGRKFFYIFDEFYEQGVNTDSMADLVMAHPNWKDVVRTGRNGVIDIASRGHRDSTESAIEVWQRRTDINFNMEYQHENALIERIRTSAKGKRFLVSPKCRGLLCEAGLGEPVFEGMHHWKYIGSADGRVLSETPKDAWNHCHDDKTEILTERGWVRFPDLLDDDRVAVWGDTMSFEKPTEVIREAYSGPLLVREGTQVDFAVTPNHRMWVANQYSVKCKADPRYSFVQACDLPYRSWVSRVAPGWTGSDVQHEFIQRTQTGYNTVRPKPEAFARFVGLWLAEGCLGRGGGKHYVIVDQKKYIDEVREIVRATGFNWCETVRKSDGIVRFSIQSKDLYNYFSPDGVHCVAATKRVPREFVNGTPESIKALLDGYRLGDGSYWGKEGWWYGSSRSKGLLDDLQEMAFRIGLIANVYLATDSVPEANKQAGWYLSVRPTDGPQTKFGLVTLDANEIKECHYEGMVYCVTTKAGIIATRRNGRVIWAGNSAKALGYGLLYHVGPVERVNEQLTMNRLSPGGKGPNALRTFSSRASVRGRRTRVRRGR